MRLLHRLQTNAHTWFLIGISFLFFLLKFPSFFEPYWYGDEAIYETLGFALRHGRALYSGIWDNKPPLLYVIYALFSGDQPSVRFFAFLVELAAVLSFFFLSKKLFRDKKNSYILTTIFAFLLALPVLEGNIANAENFMLFPIITAAVLVYMFIEKTHLHHEIPAKKLFLPGILLGIAFLIKIVAVFDFAAFFLILLFVTYKNIPYIKEQIKKLFYFVIGFFLPLLLTMVYFFITGRLSIFIQSVFFNNVGYVGWGNQFIIPQGLLIFKSIILFLACFVLFLKRRDFSTSFLFVFLWSSFSLFNMLFSQRPYTHYVLVLLPSLLLLFGLLVEEKKRMNKRIILGVAIIMVLITIPTFYLYKGLPHKTVGYYGNFISYLFNQKPTEKYYAFFDSDTMNDYAISAFINLHKKQDDSVFIWGDNAEVYRLTNTLPPGKYVVAYHINTSQKTIKETTQSLNAKNPTFVVVYLKMSPSIPFSLDMYKSKYVVGDVAIYEKSL